ncbi:hypothetical protein [Saccharolobus shibatae]|uniref:MCM C-terminal domain-containing protein n=1 Tax=Saccharolobus shibatae TaxID=2286 RepID=A0A8F5C1M4_9CREN|nr:hypothetical protein [Saccharolobus shibatae]QXJ35509.1 hypothetical protein J5U22_02056 [Saccharolobus shibatae]
MNLLREGGKMGSKNRYLRVIRVCKGGCKWSDIKNGLESLEGIRLNDNIVYTISELPHS